MGMMTFLKTGPDGSLDVLQAPKPGCWISVTNPNQDEVEYLHAQLGVLQEFLNSALDPEETSHIDQDVKAGQTLIIADCCIQRKSSIEGIPACITVPVSLIFLPDIFLTISIIDNPFIYALEHSAPGRIDTGRPVHFFLQLMMAISQKYQVYLRLIKACSEKTSEKLYLNMNNQGIEEMMELDKSLIYFAASLETDGNTLQKIRKTRILDLPEEDLPLLDDVLIEYQQASDMCTIYTMVNERVSSGCNNIISNNMNDIMKKLTVITIVMSIPNMIYGFYGMNVADLPLPYVWFPTVLSIAACIVCWFFFRSNRKYK